MGFPQAPGWRDVCLLSDWTQVPEAFPSLPVESGGGGWILSAPTLFFPVAPSKLSTPFPEDGTGTWESGNGGMPAQDSRGFVHLGPVADPKGKTPKQGGSFP